MVRWLMRWSLLLGVLLINTGCFPALLVGMSAAGAGGYLVGKKATHEQKSDHWSEQPDYPVPTPAKK